MIRPVTEVDVASIVDMVVAAQMFAAEDAGVVTELLADYFAVQLAEGHRCVVDRVRDYYTDGEDMVLFRKALAAS